MVAVAAFFGALSVQVASAEMALVANIPFDFQVGNQQMPAGKYTVAKAESSPSVLWIRDIENRHAANVQAIPAHPKMERDKGLLVFNKYGERYFLREVWRPGMSNGAQIRPSRTEREIMRAAAPERVNVIVVATR
jgi:hypothetical protein